MKSDASPCFLFVVVTALAIGASPAAAATAPAAPAAPAEDALEDILGNAEDEKSYEEVIDLLDTTLRQPVNLASAGRDEIARLPYVSPWLADSIVAARQRGDLRSVSDLGRIAGVDERLVELLAPFIIVRPPAKAGMPIKNNVRLRVVASPPTDSFTEMKTFGAYAIDATRLRAGVLVEKDKGEKMVNDFQAYYVEKDWRPGTIVLGDFVLSAGHGLVFSDGSGVSPTTVDPWRFSRGRFGLRPATSSEENFMFEGAGAIYESGRFGVALALSRSRLDATLDADGKVSALGQTGLHVTRSEVAGRNALKETLIGAAARYASGAAQVTLTLSRAELDRELDLGSIRWSKDKARFAGSADLWWQSGRTITFGEVALCQGGGPALLGGIASERQDVRVLVLGRDYSESYLSLHARPFAFYSGIGQGEQGLFTGIVFRPSPVGSVSLGNDLHRRGGDEEGALAQSGSETFADIRIKAGDFTFTLGEKFARGEEPPSPVEIEELVGAFGPAPLISGDMSADVPADMAEAADIDQTEESRRLRSRFDIQYAPVRKASFRFRYEALDATSSEGLISARSTSDLLRLDASLVPVEPLTVKVGFYAFSIEDYASRIYQYESGLPYYPQLELLKSDGSRWYCVLLFDTGGFGRIAAKFGRTLYESGEDRQELLAAYVGRF